MKYDYRDQDLYGEPGYQGRGGGQSGGQTYSLYPGSQGLSVDLPSPDSGLGSDQVSYTATHPQHVVRINVPRGGPKKYKSINVLIWAASLCRCLNPLVFIAPGSQFCGCFWCLWPKYVYFSEWGIVRAIRLWHWCYHPAIAWLASEWNIWGILHFTLILSVNSTPGRPFPLQVKWHKEREAQNSI